MNVIVTISLFRKQFCKLKRKYVLYTKSFLYISVNINISSIRIYINDMIDLQKYLTYMRALENAEFGIIYINAKFCMHAKKQSKLIAM